MSKKLVSLLILLSLITSLFGCSQSSEPLSESKFMLGTIVTITLYDNVDEKIIDKAFDRISEIEDRMSVNIKDSDISKINRNAGIKPVEVSEDVYYVLKKAKEYAKLSDGAFEPTIGPLVNLWGIGSEDAKVPTELEIKKALGKVDYNKLELKDNNEVYLKEEGMVIDLGAIAKGYAADEVKKVLIDNKVKSAIIDLGGNAYVHGSKPDGNKWKVGIQNPFTQRGRHIGIITGEDMSVVTSGNYERYFEKDGVRYHHILDSKTGYPSNTEVAGISVISEKSIDGDALSTSFFVLGVKEGLELANKLNGIEVIYITKENKVYISKGLDEEFKMTKEEFQLIKP